MSIDLTNKCNLMLVEHISTLHNLCSDKHHTLEFTIQCTAFVTVTTFPDIHFSQQKKSKLSDSDPDGKHGF